MHALRKTPQSASAADLPARLRFETMEAHESIEAHPAFSRLMAPGFTKEAYAGHLARLLGFYDTAERLLEPHRAVESLCLDRRLIKTRTLRQDLYALGYTADAINALPRWAGCDLTALDKAWGYLYVIEGSTLGGKLIARHLTAELGLTPLTGLAFHQVYGDSSGGLWRHFKQATIQGDLQGWLNPDAVIAAANQAFADLQAWFDTE